LTAYPYGIAADTRDIIEIEGKKTTAAKVWRADRNDWEENIIRIDGLSDRMQGLVSVTPSN